MADDTCKKKVECLTGLGPVKCMPCGEFNLGGELFMHDLIAQEHLGAVGVEVELYLLNRKNSVVDPLYGEAESYAFDGPVKLTGFLQYPAASPEARKEGYRETRAGDVWIARAELEAAGCRGPRENDVIGLWNIPYFNNVAVTNKGSSIRRFFFNVTNVDEDGFPSDRPEFLGFQLTLARNTEFVPERRVFNK